MKLLKNIIEKKTREFGHDEKKSNPWYSKNELPEEIKCKTKGCKSCEVWNRSWLPHKNFENANCFCRLSNHLSVGNIWSMASTIGLYEH